MSALSLLSRAHDLIASQFGPVPFTIAGIDGAFSGVLDQHQAEREMESGKPGFQGIYSATIAAKVGQFAAVEGLLERVLVNKKLTVGARIYRIVHANADQVGVTLILNNWTSDRA